MVLWGRFKFKDENRSVSMVIRNLAVSDLFMSVYLGIISIVDYQHRENYHQVASSWTQSWGCSVAGILSMISSEVTILILTFMSIERFLLISDPFGHHRLNTKNVLMSLYIIWLIGVSIAILPAILFHSSTKFYGIHNGGTCFPLFIIEKYPSGWFYSAFVFLGINFSLLALIASLYSALLISIWKTRRATTLDFFDCEFAIRWKRRCITKVFFSYHTPYITGFSSSYLPTQPVGHRLSCWRYWRLQTSSSRVTPTRGLSFSRYLWTPQWIHSCSHLAHQSTVTRSTKLLADRVSSKNKIPPRIKVG